MIFYTAVGNRVEEDSGRFVVRVGEQEKVLSEMETMIWAALTWSVCEEANVHSQMYRLLCIALGKEKAMEWADEEDFRFCLNRLVRRGLVARCEGETKEEALFFLFQRAVLKPICYSFSDRMRNFTDSLAMGKGIKFALRAFQKPTFSYEGLYPDREKWNHFRSFMQPTKRNSKGSGSRKTKRGDFRTGQPGVFTHFSFPVQKETACD